MAAAGGYSAIHGRAAKACLLCKQQDQGAFPIRLSACEKALDTIKEQMQNAKAEAEKPFAQEQELAEKTARRAELDALLNIDKRENDVLDAEPEHQDERTQTREDIER